MTSITKKKKKSAFVSNFGRGDPRERASVPVADFETRLSGIVEAPVTRMQGGGVEELSARNWEARRPLVDAVRRIRITVALGGGAVCSARPRRKEGDANRQHRGRFSDRCRKSKTREEFLHDIPSDDAKRRPTRAGVGRRSERLSEVRHVQRTLRNGARALLGRRHSLLHFVLSPDRGEDHQGEPSSSRRIDLSSAALYPSASTPMGTITTPFLVSGGER